ncbi:alpha/beta fold hydrolase [Streptomyces tagetis]|uniref:Alpha/beta fold hydrolase n=1 Tax=Streptomyces tagetis TaxID=2820809 RepID=A0A941AWS6_9ACTN|nr:alpha/beta hydrolase [Streptomyces sp. RG38]MBQ0825144.1 alpha/beta fold hydrolase [Streptomyces sp. RG38]
MIRSIKATAVAALCCGLAGAGLVGCEDITDPKPRPAVGASARDGLITGTQKIQAGGYAVNVSCTGGGEDGEPVVVLMPGAGDGLDTMAGLQKKLSEKARVCSYDRPGEGKSDKPDGRQRMEDAEKVLTEVLDRTAGDGPVVLAAHSLGGLIAARYAPDHQDRVKGLVLLDATIPELTAGVSKVIPETAEGPGAELRAQTLAMNQGENPEKLVVDDEKVRPAGDIPVEILRHEHQFDSVPEYGPGLEDMWADGQKQWRALSDRSTLSMAERSGHHIHVDRPDLAQAAVERVVAEAAGE